MADETLISWADMTFNPWVGCTRVSPACDGCYAAHLMETRLKRVKWGGPGVGNGTRDRTKPDYWRQPLAWNRAARAEGRRPFVFCASLADVFDNAVPTAWRTDLFELIHTTPDLIWLLLTKRPQNIVRMYGAAFDRPWPRNAAIGTTIEDQQRADHNVPHLLAAKAELEPAFAFVSCEPLLEPIDIRRWIAGSFECAVECGYRAAEAQPPIEERCHACGHIGKIEGEFCPGCGAQDFGYICPQCGGNVVQHHPDTPIIDWVIAGGETDQGKHKARPTHPGWLRNLRNQCAEAGVPFHFKQWGEWAPVPWKLERLPKESVNDYKNRSEEMCSQTALTIAGNLIPIDHKPWSCERALPAPDPTVAVKRVGKKAAGRLLDGIEHNAFPEVRP